MTDVPGPAPAPSPGAAPPPTCPNCGRPASGRFCGGCGQERGPLFPTVGEWLREVLAETLGADGRLPRSIRKLLWPPGELTREWFRGRRASYVRPFRLYLASAFLFFLAWPYTPVAAVLTEFAAGFQAGVWDVATTVSTEDPAVQRVVRTVAESLPAALLIVFVPLFAALLALVGRGPGGYGGSFVLALHVHTFAFLAAVATVPVSLLAAAPPDEAVVLALGVLVLAFSAAALRRVHGVGRWRAWGQAAGAASAYLLLLLGGLAAVLVAATR